MTSPPRDLRPTCARNTPCPSAIWRQEPWGWVCSVCHPPIETPASRAVFAKNHKQIKRVKR